MDTGRLARAFIDVGKKQALGLIELLDGNLHGLRQDPPRQILAGRLCDAAIVAIKEHGWKELVRIRIKATDSHLADKWRRVIVVSVQELVGIIPPTQVAFTTSTTVFMLVVDNLKLIENRVKVAVVSIGCGLDDNANGRNAHNFVDTPSFPRQSMGVDS